MKRYVSIILVVIILSTSLVFAEDTTYTDRDQSDYMGACRFFIDSCLKGGEADDILVDSYMIFGYTEINRVDDIIPRSLYTLVLGKIFFEGKTTDGVTVPWYKKYTDAISAYDDKILKLDDDGELNLDKDLTPEYAVPLLVRLLGYESQLVSNADYLEYVKKAHELGLMKGLYLEYGKGMSRGETIKLIENALFAPIKPLNDSHKNYRTILDIIDIAIYDNMELKEVKSKEGTLIFEDSKGNTESFYYGVQHLDNLQNLSKDELSKLIMSLQGKKVSVWVYIGNDGRDLETKMNHILDSKNDLILRIMFEEYMSEESIIRTYSEIETLYDADGEVTKVDDIKDLRAIKFVDDDKIYNINKYTFVDEEIEFKAHVKLEIVHNDSTLLVIDSCNIDN